MNTPLPDPPPPSRKKGPRLVGAVIFVLIVLFIVLEIFIQESQEFSPTNLTKILLTSLQVVVLLLGLILFFVLGRYMVKLKLERRHKVPGAHFKTKLVVFFIALSFVPTVLLFFFASDFIGRNIESWFQTPLDRILEESKDLADGFYLSNEEIAAHYAQQIARAIEVRGLARPENRPALKDFTYEKLKEYKLDEISVFLDDEELFSWINPNLPLRDYREVKMNLIKRAQLGEDFRSAEPMGKGEIVRRGVAFNVPGQGSMLIVTGRFLPESYAGRIASISSYVQRYRLGKIQKNPVKTFYLMMLVFITLLIIFAASWIGFHLARSITVPIEKLAAATREVSRGNLAVRVEDPASDEIGTLIDSFNQMIADLGDSQRNIARQTGELESRKRYIETILDKINTGVLALDSDGAVATVNPSARDMLALPERGIIGRSYQDILDQPGYREIVKTIDWGMRTRSPLSDKEFTVAVNGQAGHLALALLPLRTPGGEFSGLIVVLDNLTQLIKAQKMAAWKEVAQRVAHEIKNPLTPIQLSAERIIKTLRRGEPPPVEIMEEGARTIIQEARTIKALVDEFSNFARMPKVEVQTADLQPVILQTVGLFRGIFTDIVFDVETAPDLPRALQIDPEQLKRAVINILDNAIDAMNKKGRIAIRTVYNPAENRVSIVIADSGPGISIEDKAKLFLPHYSTKKRGTGLGLAIVNQIVRDHNGTVTVENNRPHGAVFTIHLPA